jgi:hypothetical protein
MAALLNNSTWLQWMATLMGGSRQTYATTFPPDRFYCLLDELPWHLLPQSARQSLQAQEDRRPPLVLNPECALRAASDVPEEYRPHKDLLSRFTRLGTIAWARASQSALPLPFWLGPNVEDVLRRLRPNQLVPSSVSARMRAVLAAAQIVVPEDGTIPASGGREESPAKARADFRTKGYAPLSHLIHPFHLAALRRYYRYRIRTGALSLGDGQSPRRYVDYNEPVARFFHHQIASRFSELAGELLKPSYVYAASYLSGAELKKHTDREQCDYSITLCLDYAPEPALATPWPIQLDTRAGRVQVYQAIGDGLAYRGIRLPHYRDRLAEGQTSTSIFFHYVRQDFAGSLG